MSLKAILTVGWTDDTKYPFSVRELHDNADNTAKKSTENLHREVKDLEDETKINYVDCKTIDSRSIDILYDESK